jgi:RNA polymerase-binding transcription factor DksA
MRVSSRFDWQQQSRLLDERDRLRRLLKDLRKAAVSRSDYEPHDITDDEAALQADLIETRLAATDKALERIEVGEYGLCCECGLRIASDRLEALPAAAHCLPCAS